MDDLKIFVIYLNVNNFSDQKVSEIIYNYSNYFNDEYKTHPNIKFHILPVYGNQETRVECIYPPLHPNKKESDLVTIYRLLLQDKNNEAIEKMKILERKLKIYKLNNKNEY